MRSTSALTCLGLAGALTACLSAPTGRDPGDAGTDAAANLWPPDGADIEAIATGDLDRDGDDDLVALDVAGGALYLLRGGDDLVPGRAVTTYSVRTPLADARAPATIAFATAGQVHLVVLDTPTSGVRLSFFNAGLEQTGTSTAPATRPGAEDTVTLGQTTFGVAMNAVFGSVPDGVFFVEGGALGDAMPQVLAVPSTGGTPFAEVAAVAGFVSQAGTPLPRIVVSEPTTAQRADVATPGGFAWSTVRSGNEWSGQTVADINGDTYPDIIGFAPEGAASAQICALDSQAATALTCLTTPFGMNNATIAIGGVVQAAQHDVVLLDMPPAGGNVGLFVVPDLQVSGADLTAGPASQPGMFAAQDPRLAIADLDGGPREILLVGRDGTVLCARSSGGAPAACN